MVFSYIQARPLLAARKHGQTSVETSLDLGMSVVSVSLTNAGVMLPTSEVLPWSLVEKVGEDESTCYTARGEPVRSFSESTNRVLSLVPTRGAPALLLSGFLMHRIKDISPWQHAERMIAALSPIRGRVLDTTTGLGYTTILAARSAATVTTIELDPAAQEIARYNPWSRELFTNSRITRLMGDACEVIPTFEDERFEHIMHDPPMFKLAGELYSGAFYRELYRILTRGGRLFHYVGDPESKASGSVTRGVLRRLQEAGFARVVKRAEAYGVVAYK